MKLTDSVYVYFKVNIKRPFNFSHVTYSWNDGSPFPPLKKKKFKKVIVTFYLTTFSQNWDINMQLRVIKSNCSGEMTDILRIFWLNLQFRVIKSELRDINSQFWEKSHNCEFISHNSEKKVRIARCKLTMTFFIQWQKWTSTHNVASNYWFNRLGTDWIVKVGVPFQNDVVGGCGLFVSG